ncbi:MAG TPA: helix-turn-helix domain-containing protein [Oscillatoriaceae cyanobacterium]
MTTFAPVQEQAAEAAVELLPICIEMRGAGLPSVFILEALFRSSEYEAIGFLFQMWHKAKEPKERDEIIADIQQILDDVTMTGIIERPAVSREGVRALIKDLRAFKDALRELVDRQGGISWLAKETGIPQPSLSRLFNAGSKPHRATLLKIREALGDEGTNLISPWLDR